MRKAGKRIGLCFIIAALFWCGTAISDRQRLNRELIRLHVVANSDSQEDQVRKLCVRDAVTDSLSRELKNAADVNEARIYLQEKLPVIQSTAQAVLRELGCDDQVSVSLCREAFDTRVYDTFVLPAGVYDALRIVIGEGEGKNWWCVVFPQLCIPAAATGFEEVAVGAGFPQTLGKSLVEEEGYELRFGVLDLMGKLENLLFAG